MHDRATRIVSLRDYRALGLALELALEAARAVLHDDDDLDDWLPWFTRRGTTLSIHARLDVADPFSAAHVVQALAACAVEGVVDLRRGSSVDSFVPGDDP
ncbi:MAG TPA: hypothetical protein VGG74_28295 [Kofleriaceae bacterium]|jgi:hypothetical protein